MRVRLVSFLVVAFAALAAAGCGGSGDEGTDPASVAPAGTPLYIEATIGPDAETAEAVDALAETIAGVENLGELVIAELEFDRPVDFASEVEPWLGERAGLFPREYDGDDFVGYNFAIQVTDEAAAREFVAEQLEGDDAKQIAYEGVEFAIDPEDGAAVGVFGGLLVLADDRQGFEEAVDAGAGDSLAAAEAFGDAAAGLPGDAFADLYVDIGALIEDSGEPIDPDAQVFLDAIGLEPGEATLAASLIPSTDSFELDVSTDLTGENPSAGDVSELLGSLPAGSVAAFATPELGAAFGELVDRIDENGIEGEVPPNQFKDALKVAGIDVEAIGGAVGAGAVFVAGGRGGPSGGLVLEATDPEEAADAVADVGAFLGEVEAGVIGPAGEGLTGFSLRSPDLGEKPLIVAGEGGRVVVAYGFEAAVRALDGDGETLADDPGFQAAAEALGETPISAYVKGPPTLRLVGTLVDPGDEDFEDARPYLEKVDYIAVGTGADGNRSTAKAIIGVAD